MTRGLRLEKMNRRDLQPIKWWHVSPRTDIQGKFDYYFPRTTYVDKGATDSIGKF